MQQAVIQAVELNEGFKIVGWRNVLCVEDLPDDYFNKFPVFYEDVDENDDSLLVIIKGMTVEMNGGTANIHIRKREIQLGEIIQEKEFNELLGLMKQAGERLAVIGRAAKYEEDNAISFAI